MNLIDAVRRMVRDYPGDVEAMALRLGKSPTTLDKELRRAPGFKLGADDACEISSMCMDLKLPAARAFLTAWALRMGCFVIPLEPLDGGEDECLRTLSRASSEMHDLMREVLDALADGQVSDNELARIDKEASHLVAAVQALRSAAMARNQQGKPLQAVAP